MLFSYLCCESKGNFRFFSSSLKRFVWFLKKMVVGRYRSSCTTHSKYRCNSGYHISVYTHVNRNWPHFLSLSVQYTHTNTYLFLYILYILMSLRKIEYLFQVWRILSICQEEKMLRAPTCADRHPRPTFDSQLLAHTLLAHRQAYLSPQHAI